MQILSEFSSSSDGFQQTKQAFSELFYSVIFNGYNTPKQERIMRILLMSLAAAGLGLAGCSKPHDHSGHNSALLSHSYPVINTAGQKLGIVTIQDTSDGVDVNLDISSIPAGEHAIHFHTTGACDGAGGFKSSGGHYNPKSVEHGHHGTTGPHAGDMKNFNAPQSGLSLIHI